METHLEDLEQMSEVERIKAASNHLRGTIKPELAEPSPAFTGPAAQLLKFHGVYQQDDRDRRRAARQAGLDKHWQMMIRTRVPGGVVSPDGYLAHAEIARRWGGGTLRVTTRQNFQLHGVLKADLRASLRAINRTLMTTLGGCGDQQRNIMCCPAPLDGFRAEVVAVLAELVPALTPRTAAYHEIWLDDELAVSSRPAGEVEDLYGDRYLPRKFKTGIAIEGDNCVDVYSNDLGLVARSAPGGGVAGFDVLVGGGLGRTANKADTLPMVARPLGFVSPDRLVELCRAVVGVQRDHGNRRDRRHARLKYLLQERGLEWFKEQVEARANFVLEPPRPLGWRPFDDHLGWHREAGGDWFYGLYVENGRIAGPTFAALAEAVAELRPTVRLTAQQNVILSGLGDRGRARLESILAGHGVTPSERVSNVLRHSMACPALPTCGLAVAESERALPGAIRELEALTLELGLEDRRISYRMTGCPNGCARPYLGDVGFVGTTLGKYDVFLGGDFGGTRLNRLYARNVLLADLPGLLRGPLTAYRDESAPGEGFGDWADRQGMGLLRQRFEVA